MAVELAGYVLDTFGQGALIGEEKAIGSADIVDLLAGEAAAAKADDVEAGQMRPVAHGHAIGNEIVLQARHASDEGVGADARELDHGGGTAEDHEISDCDVACQHHVVGQDAVASDLRVVPHMGAGQEGAAIANDRAQTTAFGARIHRHAFADHAVGADLERRSLALVFQILRDVPDGSEGKDARPRPDGGAARHSHMADELATFAQFDLGAYHTERADPHAGADLRPILDDGGRMNHGFHQSVTSMALTSASQTRVPSTFASPLYHHMLRRLFSLRMWNSTRSPGSTGLRNFTLSIVMKNTCFGFACWAILAFTQIAPAV
jgi:hypothetical protein